MRDDIKKYKKNSYYNDNDKMTRYTRLPLVTRHNIKEICKDYCGDTYTSIRKLSKKWHIGSHRMSDIIKWFKGESKGDLENLTDDKVKPIYAQINES